MRRRAKTNNVERPLLEPSPASSRRPGLKGQERSDADQVEGPLDLIPP